MTSTKIGFVLPSPSDHPLPSTRIAVLNMLPFLRAAGFDPQIVFEPPVSNARPELPGLAQRLASEGFGIVVFQKVHGASAEATARALRAAGIKTVFGVCDVVDAAMVQATDATVAVTDYLRSLYPPSLQHKIHVVHDGIENPEICKTDWGTHKADRQRPLRAVLVTSMSLAHLPVISRPPDWLEVCIVGDYPRPSQLLQRMREVRWKILSQRRDERLDYLGFLTDRRIRRVAWDPVGVYSHLREADVGIIPVDHEPSASGVVDVPSWMVKSENRLTLKMSIGLPVVASPIPSYEAVIEQGVNGFLARSPAEWWDRLDALRDPALRQRIGERARRSVQARYSMNEQARRLLAVLHDLVHGRSAPVAMEPGA
ncbi:glycosyltransferase [Piscinibacter sp. XHJ-5]|uniref:glycosyltransferase family protein n=1 Tax=Piscinibacter sp. XHJ-5 TaxID=3037797 RepID=UPI0024535E88|nr:glycosyltransferase [Piscinibacter sp. XHJ-5]